MANPNNRHVVPDPDGGWKVVAPGAQRASDAGGGEVITHGRDGRIRDSDTIAPANDPFPPRDKRH